MPSLELELARVLREAEARAWAEARLESLAPLVPAHLRVPPGILLYY